MKIGIVGATGYGGVELFRLLSSHPSIQSISLYSSSQAGENVNETYSHLNTMQDQLQPLEPEHMKEELDVIFLATPAGVSSELTPNLIGKKAKVIDLSGDLRLPSQEVYTQWYKKEAAPESVLQRAIYGLPEWNKEAIKAAKIIANPGCFPTAALLGLGPLVNERLLDPNRIIIDAKTGVSGAGKNPSAITHFAHTQENLQIYKVNQHQHIPEIEQQLTIWNEAVSPVTFSTHLIPMTRGIMATMYGELTKDVSAQQMHDCYQAYYGEHPFIRVRKQGQYPSTKDVYASNYCDMAASIDERTQRVTIVSVIDNLMKGAASQAVQNMNLVMGIEETTGLLHVPVYP
ncbi:N-acetyl-gamma-glutamyl-phosphate reductase [Halobacillus shinanisalinarum]|uniref:N-acetyl-gamma-glutamyl-phosphate reductase n=1 Tax=Halobacillus shinanisalinarum TaxID=2932258 RepID=A0ABY4H4G3_9BACI|nr:N-acetyl-gamma-glutamyl-phosphate reductase [Halobacillus shinanisalinarum]UOQ95318.1 N-acetyl-gamma-glutamyl-phosphate reductase [Halobacillus shinanisalinarum]